MGLTTWPMISKSGSEFGPSIGNGVVIRQIASRFILVLPRAYVSDWKEAIISESTADLCVIPAAMSGLHAKHGMICVARINRFGSN